MPINKYSILKTSVSPLLATALALTMACGGSRREGQARFPRAGADLGTTPVITAPAFLTAGRADLTASVPQIPGAAYRWQIANGRIQGSARGRAITFTAGPSGSTLLTCRVRQGNVLLPPSSRSCTIVPPATTPGLSVPAQALQSGQTGCQASVPTQEGCSYQWTLTNGTLTAGQGTAAITFTAGAPGDLRLACTVTNRALDAAPAGSATCAVLPPLVPAPTPLGAHPLNPGPQGVLPQVPVPQASLPQVPVPQGSLPQTPNAQGALPQSPTPQGAQPSGASAQGALPHSPTPTGRATLTLAAPSHVTAGRSGNTAAVPALPGDTWAWTVTNGSPEGPVNGPTLTFTAGTAGQTIVTCVVTNAAGVPLPPVQRICTIVPPPATPRLTFPAQPLLGEQAGYQATAPEVPGCTYQWQITNGRITQGGATATVTFTAGDAGQVGLACVVTNQANEAAQAATASLAITPAAHCSDAHFLPNGRPYLQLGTGVPATPGTLSVLWMAPGHADQDWHVEVHSGGAWVDQGLAHPMTHVRVNLGVAGEPEHRVYTQALAGLPPGGTFHYRVRLGAQVVFQSLGKALKAAGQPQRVVVVGDLVSAGAEAEARRMASRLYDEDPDLVVVPGNIVSLDGHAHQYRDSFFSIYNANEAGPDTGAPLLRTIPMATCLGSNDTDRVRELQNGTFIASPEPHGLAYYYYFANPLNGPALALNTGELDVPASLTPWLNPAAGDFGPFLAAAGPNFGRMGNYSFNSGNIHWVVLDSCRYSHEWREPSLRGWLADDLATPSAREAAWRFVVFHHPVFSHQDPEPAVPGGDPSPYTETWMRALWPTFQAGGVDLTFSAHLQAYQRAQPLSFADPTGNSPGSERHHFDQDGNIHQDLAFTGAGGNTQVAAHHIIPIVTGAGGAQGQAFRDRPGPYHHLQATSFIHGRASYSLLTVNGTQMDFAQLVYDAAANAWTALDTFRVDK